VELIRVVATDTQAFQATIHNRFHLEPARGPCRVAGWVRAAHWTIGAVLTADLAAAGRRRLDSARAVLLLGALTTIMLLLSRVPPAHLTLSVLAGRRSGDERLERAGRRASAGADGPVTIYLILNVIPAVSGHGVHARRVGWRCTACCSG